MKRLLIPFLALALCQPAHSSPQNDVVYCFQKEPRTFFAHVEGKRVATVTVMNRPSPEKVTDWEPFVEPTSEMRMNCGESQVDLVCAGGDCWVAMDSGRYGYHPGERSTVIIDGRKFSWVGDMPIQTGRQMWSALREGSVVKSAIAQLPGRYTNSKDLLNGVQQSKNLVYGFSLQGENHQPNQI